MELKTTEQLLTWKPEGTKPVMTVAGSHELHILEAVLKAIDQGAADAIFCGKEKETADILRELGRDPADFDLRNTPKGMTDSELCVEFIKKGESNFLVKGWIETTDLLHPVVKKENRLRTGRTMSHMAFHWLPSYHKAIVNTDGGMNTYPDLKTKAEIVYNAVETLRALGYEKPKVACLACKETVDEKMPETKDARALQEMAEADEFGKCVVVGPLSYDIAMSKEIAKVKHFDSPYCEDFDVLLQPNIHTANIMGKSWIVNAGAILGGVVVGCKVPIVLTSRGSSAEEKFLSILLAGQIAAGAK